jgi:hypothetical protein
LLLLLSCARDVAVLGRAVETHHAGNYRTSSSHAAFDALLASRASHFS